VNTERYGYVVHGAVCSGIGRARWAMSPERSHAIESLTGWAPVPGTLNVRTSEEPEKIAEAMGPAPWAIEPENRNGPLRMWPVRVTVGTIETDAVLVRHTRSRTRYLEIMAPIHFRQFGAKDGLLAKIAR